MIQMSLFEIEIIPDWFFWDPPFTFTRETLSLYTGIFGRSNYEIAEMETTEDGDILAKFLISPNGMNRLDVWISERKHEQFYNS